MFEAAKEDVSAIRTYIKRTRKRGAVPPWSIHSARTLVDYAISEHAFSNRVVGNWCGPRAHTSSSFFASSRNSSSTSGLRNGRLWIGTTHWLRSCARRPTKFTLAPTPDSFSFLTRSPKATLTRSCSTGSFAGQTMLTHICRTGAASMQLSQPKLSHGSCTQPIFMFCRNSTMLPTHSCLQIWKQRHQLLQELSVRTSGHLLKDTLSTPVLNWSLQMQPPASGPVAGYFPAHLQFAKLGSVSRLRQFSASCFFR